MKTGNQHHRTQKSKAIVAVTLLMLATSLSVAACNSHFFDEQPSIPVGSTATEAEMQSAQKAVKAYVDLVERDIRCVTDDFAYNTGVRRLKKFVRGYNEALHQYQAVTLTVKR